MSFDKQYPNRKDHRKPFQKYAEQISTQCRHGGSCNYCTENRTINKKKIAVIAEDEIQSLFIPETELENE